MLTSRIDQLKKQFFTHVPAVCLEGALSKTHVFKETEGEPMIVRRAKAFKRHCETKTITIQPGDRLLTLSTCAYDYDNARYVVMGELVPVKNPAAAAATEG